MKVRFFTLLGVGTPAEAAARWPNELLRPFGRVIESLLANLFVFTMATGEDQRASLMQHEAILRAIRDGKPVTARLAVRKLLARTDRTIERGRVRRRSQRKT